MVGRNHVVQKWRRLIVDSLFALNAMHCQDTIQDICEVYTLAHPHAIGIYGGPPTFADTLLCSVAGPDGSVEQRYHEYKAWLSGRGV